MPRETVLSFYDRDPDMDIRSLLAGVRVPTLVTQVPRTGTYHSPPNT